MSFKTTMNNVGFSLQKNAPYIIFGAGVVSFGVSIFTIVKATLKTADILNEYEDEKNDLEDLMNDEIETCEDETKHDIIKSSYEVDFKNLKKQTAKKVAKTYLPSVAFVGLSTGCFFVSMGMLNKRYIGALGAFTGVTEAFQAYRDRVIEDQGQDKDYEYLYGVKKEKIDILEEDPETGKTKKVKKDALTGNPEGPFAYRFEKYEPSSETGFEEWDEMGIYSYPYLSGILNQCQRKVDIGKRVWLHDVLRNELKAGEKVLRGTDILAGWAPGDRVSFGFDLETEDMMRYLRGESPDVTLIFNCRPNLYAEVYGDNLKVVDSTAKELEDE